MRFPLLHYYIYIYSFYFRVLTLDPHDIPVPPPTILAAIPHTMEESKVAVDRDMVMRRSSIMKEVGSTRGMTDR